MFGALVMRISRGVCVIKARHSAGAMHRTRHDWHYGTAQRRDPRCQKNDGQRDSD
jgi:hypothetical protein